MVAFWLFLPLADIGQVHRAAGQAPGPRREGKGARSSLEARNSQFHGSQAAGRAPVTPAPPPGPAQAPPRRTPGTRGGKGQQPPAPGVQTGTPARGPATPRTRVGTNAAPGQAPALPAACTSRRGERSLPQGRGGGGLAGPRGEQRGSARRGTDPTAGGDVGGGCPVSHGGGGRRGAAPLTGPHRLPPRTRTPSRPRGLTAARLRPASPAQATPRTARDGGPQRWEGKG